MKKEKAKPKNSPPYSPTAGERAAIEKFFEEREKNAPAPRIKVEGNEITIDHPSELIGHLLVQNAFGSLDSAFVHGLLRQLAQATSGGSKINENELNFMVSFIKGIEPRDQIESTLAAQMAAVHMAFMKFIQHLPLIENLPQQDAAERAINKFSRTYVSQMEALKRYRSGGEQKVTVQHVSVNEGGQAIVGNVTQNPREAAPEKVPVKPPALTHSKTRPMEMIHETEAAPAAVERKSRK
jgi:hypothetical protein